MLFLISSLSLPVEHKKYLANEKSRKQILKLADAAKDQLKLAELLGYSDKDNYEVFYTEIDVIKETLNSDKSSATWKKSSVDFRSQN